MVWQRRTSCSALGNVAVRIEAWTKISDSTHRRWKWPLIVREEDAYPLITSFIKRVNKDEFPEFQIIEQELLDVTYNFDFLAMKR